MQSIYERYNIIRWDGEWYFKCYECFDRQNLEDTFVNHLETHIKMLEIALIIILQPGITI